MKIISFKSILLFLLSATLAIGAVTDVVIGQRAGASSRFTQRTITGSANVFKPIGFDSTGVLSATAQLRGMSLTTPNGNSIIDITSDSTIKISINSVDSINAGTRKLINSSGAETVDWNTNTLSNNWSVTGNLRVGSEVVIGTAMAANAIDTSKALNTKTLTDNATLTFSTTPTTGQVFGVEIKNTKVSAITVAIPGSRDYNTGATVTSIIVPATPGRTTLQWRYDGTDYIINQGSSSSNEVLSSTTSVTDRLVSFTDTTGRVIKDSGETVVSLKARANHTGVQAWNTIIGTPTTLGGYGITDSQPVNTNLSSISLLSDPNVDRLLFWDDSAGLWKHLTLGTNLAITDTTLNATTSVSGGSGSGFPLTANADFGGFNASNIGIVTATSFVGDGSGLTLLTANDLVGTIPDITTETLTTSRARVVTPVAGVSNAINTGNGDTTIILDATTETLTYSAQPATGTRFEYSLTGHSADSVVTIPSTYSHALGSLRTSFTVPATKNVNIMVKREASRYVMWGDPVSITDYPANTTPTTDGILEVDQAGSSTRSTLGQIKALMLDTPVLTGGASVQGILTATTFSGSGDDLTNLPADQIVGTLPDLGTGILTTSSSKKILPVAGVSNAINTANGETTIALDATTETLSYSATPSTGTYFSYTLEGHSAASVVTIPSTYSFALGGFRTSFTAPASKPTSITVRRDAGRYIMWGDPVDIGDLSNNLSPTTAAKLEIDQGSGSEYITLNQVKTLTSTSPTFTGIVTNSGSTANTAAAMAANAIDVTKELNTKTISANTTFTFTGTPVTNQWFGLYVKNTGGTAAIVTFPLSKDSVSGASITTSTVVATTGRQHLYWRWDGTEYIIYRGTGGGTLLSGDQNIQGTLTATTFSGEGTFLDNIPGSALNGPIPDIEVDTLTTDNVRVIVPTAISSGTIDVTKGWSYKTLTSNLTISFSDTPANGTILWVEFICDSVARQITLPTAVYSDERGSQVIDFTVQANTRPLISFIKLADGWRAQGIPTQISNLAAVNSPDTTASIEIDQGTGSRRTTLANIKTALSLDTSRTGTHATPSTTTPLSPTWTGPFHTVYYGATGTINLPAASAYADKGIIIYNTGSFTITVDASGSEVIVRDGAVQTGGVSFTLSTGAGNFVNLISDGIRWITLGYKGTLTQGS